MTETLTPVDGWSAVAAEYQARERRLRALLGWRAVGRPLEAAVTMLVDENRRLHQRNQELWRQLNPVVADALDPERLKLSDEWTRGT